VSWVEDLTLLFAFLSDEGCTIELLWSFLAVDWRDLEVLLYSLALEAFGVLRNLLRGLLDLEKERSTLLEETEGVLWRSRMYCMRFSLKHTMESQWVWI